MQDDEHGSSDPEDGDTQPPSPGMGARDDDDEGSDWRQVTHAAPSDEQPHDDQRYDTRYDPEHWRRQERARLEGVQRARDEYEAENFQYPSTTWPTGEEFENEPDTDPHWVIDGPWLRVGQSVEKDDGPTVMTIAGEGGTGKSVLSADLIRAACDEDWWGGDPGGSIPLLGSRVVLPLGRTIVYANLEMSKTLLRTRFMRPLNIVNKKKYVPVTLPSVVPIMSSSGRDWWVRTLGTASAGVWLVDSHAILANGTPEDDAMETTRVIHRIRDIAAAVGCVVILLDHTGWSARNRVRGSSAKRDRVDVMLSYEMTDPDDHSAARLLTITKTRWADTTGTSVRVDFDPATRRHAFTAGSRAEIARVADDKKKRQAEERADSTRRSVIAAAEVLHAANPAGSWKSKSEVYRQLHDLGVTPGAKPSAWLVAGLFHSPEDAQPGLGLLCHPAGGVGYCWSPGALAAVGIHASEES